MIGSGAMWDTIGGKQRAWAVAGCGWMVDWSVHRPFVMLAEGERPVLCLPPGLTAEDTEQAFGWAASDLKQQREGWLALMREIALLADRTAA